MSLGHDHLASAVTSPMAIVPRLAYDVAELNSCSSKKKSVEDHERSCQDESRVQKGFDIYEESLIVAAKMNQFLRGSGPPPLLDLIPGECCPLGSLNFICLGPACRFKFKSKFPSFLTNKYIKGMILCRQGVQIHS